MMKIERMVARSRAIGNALTKDGQVSQAR